jgi:hypothetical protein
VSNPSTPEEFAPFIAARNQKGSAIAKITKIRIV